MVQLEQVEQTGGKWNLRINSLQTSKCRLNYIGSLNTVNLFTGSLFNLASFSNFALLPIKVFLLRTFTSIFHAFFITKPRQQRSSGFHLSIPRVKTHAGTCAFSVAVPTLWNSLPEHFKSSNSLISFRHYLKTYLFRFAYLS